MEHKSRTLMHFIKGLNESLEKALAKEGYAKPTPIQEQAIPSLLEGRDLIGIAQTGTGKTAAFLLPILQHLQSHHQHTTRHRPRVLILAPTRELAGQIGHSIIKYGKFLRISHTVIFGGVGQGPQVTALARGVDILVATPGRLLDLINQRYVALDKVEVFVLDEADRMFDMGFIRDIKKIVPMLPIRRQSIFFSATMSPEITALAKDLVHDPVHITIAPEQPTVELIDQKIMFLDKRDKDQVLISIIRKMDKAIVFTQMKHVANRVAEKLSAAGIKTVAIHGNKTQGARTQALSAFKSGKAQVLVATDIAARGIDVQGITHVINYDLPNEPETYVHRIGRTARAGARGDAISFCSAEERTYLRNIERLIKKEIPMLEHEFHSETARNAVGAASRPPPRHQSGSHGGQRHRSNQHARRDAPHRGAPGRDAARRDAAHDTARDGSRDERHNSRGQRPFGLRRFSHSSSRDDRPDDNRRSDNRRLDDRRTVRSHYDSRKDVSGKYGTHKGTYGPRSKEYHNKSAPIKSALTKSSMQGNNRSHFGVSQNDDRKERGPFRKHRTHKTHGFKRKRT